MQLVPPSGEHVRNLESCTQLRTAGTHTHAPCAIRKCLNSSQTQSGGFLGLSHETHQCVSTDIYLVYSERIARLRGSIKNASITSHNHLPGSGIVAHGLSGSKIPFCTSSSRLARTDIFRSKAARALTQHTHQQTRTHRVGKKKCIKQTKQNAVNI